VVEPPDPWFVVDALVDDVLVVVVLVRLELVKVYVGSPPEVVDVDLAVAVRVVPGGKGAGLVRIAPHSDGGTPLGQHPVSVQ
jgi:hypothetical protein